MGYFSWYFINILSILKVGNRCHKNDGVSLLDTINDGLVFLLNLEKPLLSVELLIKVNKFENT